MTAALTAVLLVTALQVGEPGPVARPAKAGWEAARALALKGGAVDALGPVNEQLQILDGMSGDHEARYADAAIRAAVSAAQDERDEMSIFLTHARALDAELRVLGRPARWPLPIDELEGELWLEVDRYAEARAAYERATATTGSASSWLGLARVNQRLGDRDAACRAARRALDVGGLPPVLASEAAAHCPLATSSDSRLPAPGSRP
jgi:tetratricopeptide (TPR) repeat protein